MSNPPAAHPALSDIALRETLDLMGTVIASMSDRLDKQSQTLAEVKQVAVGSRAAALTAKSQTDPQLYGRYIGNELFNAIDKPLDRLEALRTGFAADREETARKLEELTRQEERLLQHLRDDLAEAQRWKRHVLFMALFGLVLVLGLTIALPRFLAGNPTTCVVLGASWTTTTTGVDACVFYAE